MNPQPRYVDGNYISVAAVRRAARARRANMLGTAQLRADCAFYAAVRAIRRGKPGAGDAADAALDDCLAVAAEVRRDARKRGGAAQ